MNSSSSASTGVLKWEHLFVRPELMNPPVLTLYKFYIVKVCRCLDANQAFFPGERLRSGIEHGSNGCCVDRADEPFLGDDAREVVAGGDVERR